MTEKIKKNLLLTSPIYIKQKEYWLNKLSNEIVETNFQFSEIKKNQGDGDVKNLKKLELFFPDDLSVRLFKLSKKSDLSLYIILLAALKILIYRYTGNDDIIVISPVNKLKASLGTINNYLFIRDKVNGSMTFKELLLNVRKSVLQAYQNQDYPLNDLIKNRTAALQVKNDNNISNIACLLKNLHGHGNTGELNGKFTFSFAREEERIKGNILYDGSSCEKYYLDRAAAHFINILAESTGDVNVKVSDISFMAEKEKKQLLFDFNDTVSQYPWDKTIDLLFEEQAVLKPNNIAVVEADTNGFISYHELNEKADRIAVYLQQKGQKVDQAVGIMAEHSIEMITGVLAILKAGGAYLPINPGYPPERKNYLLADSNSRILITTCQHTSISASLQDVVNLKDPDVYHTVYYDLEKEHHHDNLAYIIYTSGSTGKPKGTMVEHKNVIRLVRNTNYIKFREKDRILQTGALEFDASTFEIWGVLLNCLNLYLASRDNLLAPQKLKEILKRNEITTIWITSPLFNQLVDADIEIFSKLENLLVGGDVLSPIHINRTRNRYPGLNIINGYGPTENTTFSCTYRIREEHSKNIPIGKPIANSTAYILDKYYHFVPVGVVGELLVGGDGVARGYLNNPEKTAEKFKRAVIKSSLKTNDRSAQVFAKDHSPMTNDRLYFTGDLGYWNPGGTIEFWGRKDNQVKIRGYRIELGEIENRLLEYHCIKEAVVLQKEESHDSKYLCAYLVLDGKPGKLEIKNHLLKRLPDYMVPTQFIHLEQMPLTPNGKIDRKALARINSSAAFLPYITEEMLEPLAPGIHLHPIVKKNFVNSNQMSCFITGETSLPIKCAELILNRGHQNLGMISNDPKVLDWAKKHDIARVKAKKAEIIPFLKQQPFDYLFSINNLLILSEDVLELAGKCVFNYHNGPLPAYAGSYAPYWALMNMEKTHGITWHLVDKDIDTGDIVIQAQIEIDPGDTGASLNMKCFNAGVQAFEQLLDHLEKGTVTKQKQKLSKRTYFEKYKRPETACFVSFNWEAEKIDAFVRALNFGAYENPLGLPKITVENDFFVLSEISLLNRKSQEVPGTVVETNEESIVVATSTRDIQIKKIHTLEGTGIPIFQIIKTFNLHTGSRLNGIDPDIFTFLEEYNSLICKHELFWVNRLSGIRPLKLISPDSNIAPVSTSPAASAFLHRLNSPKPVPYSWKFLIASFAAYLSRLTDIFSFHLGYTDVSHLTNVKELEGIFSNQVPLCVELDANQTFAAFSCIISKELERLRKRQTYIRDIYARYPSLQSRVEQRMPIRITCVNNLDDFEAPQTGQLHLVIPRCEKEWMILFDPPVMDDEMKGIFQQQFSLFLKEMDSNPGTVIGKFAPRPFELKARIEQLIKIDEVIIDVGKIEYCLLENDDIDEAFIDIKTDKTNKKHLCAYVTSGKSITEPKLRTYLSENLPHHMIPEYLIQLEKIPLTPNGKIRRKVLELIEPHQYIQKEFIAPRNIIEEKLLEIWANVLAIKKEIISIDSDFFTLHGNSLGVIKLISLIYKELDEEVPMTQIFKSPTIKDIAKYLLNKKYEKYENHQYILLNKSKTNPVFAFPPIVGTGLSYAKLRPYLQDYSIYSFNFIEDENRIKKYVDIITGITTNRPYVLFGYSSGGNLAFEVAKGLEESGYQVSDIIIIDSIKKLGKLPSSGSAEENEKMGEISKKIEEFLKSLGLEFMKDEAVTKSMKYSTYFLDLQNTGVVNANLHVITGEKKDGKEIESSTAFAPPTAWEKSTNNNFILYHGVGGHVEMLESNFIKKNIEIIKKILDRVFSRESQ